MLSVGPPLGAWVRSFAGIGDIWIQTVLGVLGRAVSNSQVGVPLLGPGNVTFSPAPPPTAPELGLYPGNQVKMRSPGWALQHWERFPDKKRRLRPGHTQREEEATGRGSQRLGRGTHKPRNAKTARKPPKQEAGWGYAVPRTFRRSQPS